MQLSTCAGAIKLVLFGVLAGSGTLSGQADSAGTISLRETAAALLRRGLEAGQPRLVLAAAQLLLTSELGAPARPGPAGSDSAARAAAGEYPDFTVAGLLRLASRMAVENNDAPTAAAAAALAQNPALGLSNHRGLLGELSNRAKRVGTVRGASGGPLWREGFLAPETQTEYAFAFEGGRVVNRIVVGASNPRADLECSLIQGKEVVAQDDGPGSGCDIKWDQKPAGTLTLRIRNAGPATYFVLTSN